MRIYSKRFKIIIRVVYAICVVGGSLAFKSTYVESKLNQITIKDSNYPIYFPDLGFLNN